MATTIERTLTALTVDDLLALNREGREGELWEGEFVEMSPSGGPQSWIARRVGRVVDDVVSNLGIGEVWGTEAGFTLHLTSGEATVLAPDVAVVPIEYARSITRHHQGFHDVTPLLVVEVKSPSDEEKHIAHKLAMYLDAGVPEVWWLRPEDGTVSRHWPDRGPVVLGLGDVVQEVDLLPGFAMPVAAMFPPDEADDHDDR